MMNFMMSLRKLKRRFEAKAGKFASPIQFALVGLSGMVPDLASFSVLLLWLPLPVARGIAIWVAMSWNFWLNRRLTFSYARRGSALRQYVLFCGSCLAGAVISWSICLGLCMASQFFSEKKIVAATVGVLAGATMNYLLSRHVVFLAPRPISQQPRSQVTLSPKDLAEASPATKASLMEPSVVRS